MHRLSTITFLLLAALLISFLWDNISINAHAHAATLVPLYSCGSPSANHCYGQVQWDGLNSGAQTNLFTNQFDGGDCSVNEELWDAQISGNYWVEAGLESFIGDQYGMEVTFWADNRPNGGGYTQHNEEFLSGNDFGKTATIQIVHDSSSTFAVSITGLPDTTLSGESTANPITPDAINMGMEMCGDKGASSPKNGFSHNLFRDAYTGDWTYQGLNGTVQTPNYPANGYWTIYPKQDPSGTGGQFTVCVQGNGC